MFFVMVESNINHFICKQVSPNLDTCIELALRWAEDFSRRIQEVYSSIYPNGNESF